MSDLWLDPDDVSTLTARRRWSAQCNALSAMGIPFLRNAAGRPLVERGAISISRSASRKRSTEPNW